MEKGIMNEKSRIIDLLRRLGLSQYGASVFLELFKRSPQSASSITEGAGVPRGRVYQVLQELSQKGLVVIKPSRGKSNLYELAPHPEGLLNLLEDVVDGLESEKRAVSVTCSELIAVLSSFDRTSVEVEREKEQITVVRGPAAKDYYIKKILSEAREHVVTNFTSELLIKYESLFQELRDREVKRSFFLTEKEIPLAFDVLRGSDVYMVPTEHLDVPLLSVFSDMRPPMVIVDDKIGVHVMHESEDALLVKSPELLRQMMFILSIIKKDTVHRKI